MTIADPWSSTFLDVESLNANVSDTIVNQVAAIKTAASDRREFVPAACNLVLGPPGAGKTHLFARLRKRLGPGAALVHLRPDLVTGLTPRGLLAAVIESLLQPSFCSERSQLKELIGGFLAQEHPAPGRTIFAGAALAYLDALPQEVRRARVEKALVKFEDLFRPAAASSRFLQFLLELPFVDRADYRARLVWLCGQEPDEGQLTRLGVTSEITDAEILPAIRTLAALAALGTPLLIVFDQLENLIEESGTALIGRYARLVSQIIDTVRGVVVVQLAIDSEWVRRVRPHLGLQERARVEPPGNVLQLALPDARQREELLRDWLASLPQPLPFPGPFSDADLQRWHMAAQMTPRMLLSEFKERFTAGSAALPAGETESDSRAESLAARWEAEQERARVLLDQSTDHGVGVTSARLAAALLTALRGLDAAGIAEPVPHNLAHIKWEQRGATIRIIALQERHWRTIARVVHEAAALDGRVIVIREASLPLRPTWRATQAAVSEFARLPGKTFNEINRDDTARILALESFLAAARSCEISDALGICIEEPLARAWIRDVVCPATWEVIATITNPVAPPETALPPENSADPVPAAPAAPARALAVLERLQLASLERVFAEVRREDPAAKLRAVRTELEGAPAVTWFGRSIVALRSLET